MKLNGFSLKPKNHNTKTILLVFIQMILSAKSKIPYQALQYFPPNSSTPNLKTQNLSNIPLTFLNENGKQNSKCIQPQI